jgi:hypothetical protein
MSRRARNVSDTKSSQEAKWKTSSKQKREKRSKQTASEGNTSEYNLSGDAEKASGGVAPGNQAANVADVHERVEDGEEGNEDDGRPGDKPGERAV